MLEVFFASHNPCASAWSRQYMSAVWYHDDAQKRAVEVARAKVEKKRGKPVRTHVGRFEEFWLAEDYHQKHALRRHGEFERAFLEIYPDLDDFVSSTAVTKVNAWLAGYGDKATIERLRGRLGLRKALADELATRVR